MVAGSPAECSGLQEGDRILAVNHTGVERCRHAELAARIRAVQDEVCLLVIDRDTERLCDERGVSYIDDSHRVKHIMCPHLPPPTHGQTPVSISKSITIAARCACSAGWWRSGNALCPNNEVTLHPGRLVLGWPTICWLVNHPGM